MSNISSASVSEKQTPALPLILDRVRYENENYLQLLDSLDKILNRFRGESIVPPPPDGSQMMVKGNVITNGMCSSLIAEVDKFQTYNKILNGYIAGLNEIV